LFVSGGELFFIYANYTLPANFFGLVRPPALRFVRPNHPHQLAGNER
jgi:hypothetical protein